MSQDQHAFLKKLSFDSGKSISEILRGYIDQFSSLPTLMKHNPSTTQPLLEQPSSTPKAKIKDLPNYIDKDGNITSGPNKGFNIRPFEKGYPKIKLGLVKKRGELNAEDYL